MNETRPGRCCGRSWLRRHDWFLRKNRGCGHRHKAKHHEQIRAETYHPTSLYRAARRAMRIIATPIRNGCGRSEFQIRISVVPKISTTKRARRAARAGKAPSTQAGEFVREEIETIRSGEHGARSAKQAIAIGLSKARRAGVKLPAPKRGKASDQARRQAKRDLKVGKSPARPKSRRRARASLATLKREGKAAASHQALSRHARASARSRPATERSASARRAARTREKSASSR